MSEFSQLNEAESKFFESKGRDVAPALAEDAAEPGSGGAAEAIPAPDSAEAGNPEPAAHTGQQRDKRFVPLQALQEERAEKKQLREELRQYREWQAQLTQRLQQMPVQQQAPMPDPETRPLDYINHVLSNMQASTAELQQWREQQERTAQQRLSEQRLMDWAESQGQAFSKEQPDYADARRHALDARDRELKALGYSSAERAAILRLNEMEVANSAFQQGRNPAELVWDYARARGFAPKARNDGASKIAAGMQAAGGKLNQGGTAGDGDLSAKDLVGISDPDEFEKAWKRVFGKRR